MLAVIKRTLLGCAIFVAILGALGCALWLAQTYPIIILIAFVIFVGYCIGEKFK